MRIWVAVGLAALLPVCMAAQKTTDSSRILPDGTAVVTRVVLVPKTISPAAQKWLGTVVSDVKTNPTVAQQRAGTDKWQADAGAVSKRLYPANVGAATIAGVPVRVVTPLTMSPAKKDYVLINVHGGGFVVDSGSLTETIPMANLTGMKVISVLYRMAPEHPFPAAVDDTIAVYREVLKTYKAKNIGLYGTSAGAILTAEVTAKIKQLGLPMPGATGVFSGTGDLSQGGDSTAIFALNGFSGYLAPPEPGKPVISPYVGKTNPRDPILSPLYSDVRGFPPTLFITSTRDLLLSGTTILDRAYLRAGVDTQLIVFEALPHAFWNNPTLPEAKEADRYMAAFFLKHLGK
ncbi:MAG: alpha/beta hydrolase fold domain-containing protein [Acidobacteriaceae bacterium]